MFLYCCFDGVWENGGVRVVVFVNARRIWFGVGVV